MDIAARWHDALAPLARLSPKDRLIRLVAAPGGDSPAALEHLLESAVLAQVQGYEAVCAPFRFTASLLALSAELDLAPLLGQPLGLQLVCADGTPRTWFGLCTEVASDGSDGGLARYTLTLEPFTAALALRRNTLIFQDQDVGTITGQVLDDHPSSALRWDVSQALPVRAITTQYRETDFDFLQRLLAEAGLAWYFEHGDGPSGHTWVIRDRESAWAQGTTIRFHRIDASESEDAIAAFSARRQAVPSGRMLASWHRDQVATRAASSVGDPGALPEREVFGLPRDGRLGEDWAQAAADLQLDALRLSGQVFTGSGSARGLRPAQPFTLTGHDGFEGQAFVPMAVTHSIRNNLGGGMVALLADLGQPVDDLDRGSYRNHFIAVAAATPVVPQDRPRPLVHGPQTARVVGHPDAAVSASREHQVRVQFPWQRGAQPVPGGLEDAGSTAHPDGHAPGDASSGTWVPVAEWLAGPNWGSHFLPRIGAEVLVEFQHGDPDQPLVAGQLYNGAVAPPFAAGVDGASNHPGTLSGLHTQAHDGGLTQQWVLDDATGQLRQRLHTALADSRLELGYLVQHANGQRGGLRGQGFELATAGWGNLHAPQGLLLSTTLRGDATSTQLDVAEAVAQLKGAERTAQALDETLRSQQVPGLAANPGQTALREAIDPDADGIYSGSVNGQSATKPAEGAREGGDPVERFASPLLVAESPDRIAFTTPASALAQGGGNLHLTTQQDGHIAATASVAGVAGQHLALYAHAGPIRAIAAQGPVTAQAHTGELELLADQSVTITATDARIDVLAREKIVLQAGQTRVTLQGGNITFECPGNFIVKASQHPFLGGESNAAGLEALPQHLIGEEPFTVRLKLRDEAGKAIANQKLRVWHEDGAYEDVETNADGDTRVVMSGEQTELLKIQLADDEVWEVDDTWTRDDDENDCCPTPASAEGADS